jgi:nucleoside-diphosphate-sugar epimerase
MVVTPSQYPVVISGISGFIGQHLAHFLAGEGYPVMGLIREGTTLARPLPPSVSLVRFSSPNAPELPELFKQCRPQAVIHLATHFLGAHQYTDIPALMQANLTFGTQLLEASVQAEVPVFLNTATAWQHYQNQPYSPVNLYAATKQAFEAVLQYYSEAYPLKAATLTIFESYGPHDTRRKLIPALLQAAKSGTLLDMVPPEQQLDMVHVQDVVRAFERALHLTHESSGSSVSVYGIATGEPVTLQQLLDTLNTVITEESDRSSAFTAQPIRCRWGARCYRSREALIPWRDYTPLPQWAPRIPLGEGLRQLLQEML